MERLAAEGGAAASAADAPHAQDAVPAPRDAVALGKETTGSGTGTGTARD
jgi:hypothetical protein